MRRVSKVIACLFIAVFLGYTAGSAAFLLRLPSEIRLPEYATHKVNIGLRQPILVETQSSGTSEVAVGVFGMPFRRIVLDVVPDVKIVPLGTSIGVRINTDGVMVLGMGSFLGEDGQAHRPSDGVLRAGDLIFQVNDTTIKSKEDLSRLVAKSTGDITLHLRREGAEMAVTLSPAVAETDGVRRIGAWVRDSTKGIGTLTYYNPSTGTFGALGHGIMDVDTKKLMSVKSGIIMPSTETSVKRGARGAPGELEGKVDSSRTIGQITANNNSGIYGTLSSAAHAEIVTREPMPIALRAHIKEGPATILTNVSGTAVQEFDIEIENVNRNSTDETKGMIIRITDPELLRITGGIVQGMSGSPILQNGRVVGAITHVFVQDPTKGYAIFIENMLRPENICDGWPIHAIS